MPGGCSACSRSAGRSRPWPCCSIWRHRENIRRLAARHRVEARRRRRLRRQIPARPDAEAAAGARRRRFLEPSAAASAIIAPLSVHSSGSGIEHVEAARARASASSAARSCRLAPTPPATTRRASPLVSSARTHFATSTSTTASTKARARSARLGVVLFQRGQDRRLQAGEAEIQVAAVDHRPRQPVAAGHARFGELRQRRAAGIAQAEELGGLVEGLARGVVLRLAEQRVAADAVDPHELGVAAGDQQRDERKGGRLGRQQGRQQVAFEVVDADRRDAQRRRQAVGEGGADQQGAGQARALRCTRCRPVRRISGCADSSTRRVRGARRRMWSREASSGTTPP